MANWQIDPNLMANPGGVAQGVAPGVAPGVGAGGVYPAGAAGVAYQGAMNNLPAGSIPAASVDPTLMGTAAGAAAAGAAGVPGAVGAAGMAGGIPGVTAHILPLPILTYFADILPEFMLKFLSISTMLGAWGTFVGITNFVISSRGAVGELSRENVGSSRQVSAKTRGGRQTSASKLSASGNKLSASGNKLSASGNKLSASGNKLSASGKQLSASGKQLSASGKQLSASGNKKSKKSGDGTIGDGEARTHEVNEAIGQYREKDGGTRENLHTNTTTAGEKQQEEESKYQNSNVNDQYSYDDEDQKYLHTPIEPPHSHVIDGWSFDIGLFLVMLLTSSATLDDPVVGPLSWIFLIATILNQALRLMEDSNVTIKNLEALRAYSTRIRLLCIAGTNMIGILVSSWVVNYTNTVASYHEVPTQIIGLYGIWHCVLCIRRTSQTITQPVLTSEGRVEENKVIEGDKEYEEQNVPKTTAAKQTGDANEKPEVILPRVMAHEAKNYRSPSKETLPMVRQQQFDVIEIDNYSMMLYLLLSSLASKNSGMWLMSIVFLFLDIAVNISKKIGRPLPINYLYSMLSVVVGLITSIWVLCFVRGNSGSSAAAANAPGAMPGGIPQAAYVAGVPLTGPAAAAMGAAGGVTNFFQVSAKLVSLYGLREFVACLPDATDFKNGHWRIGEFSDTMFMLLVSSSIRAGQGSIVVWGVAWSYFMVSVLARIFERISESRLKLTDENNQQATVPLVMNQMTNALKLTLAMVGVLWVGTFA